MNSKKINTFTHDLDYRLHFTQLYFHKYHSFTLFWSLFALCFQKNVLIVIEFSNFCRFTYITAHSPTLPLSSFSKHSVTSPTSQLILQTLRPFTYVTAHSPTLPLLHLRHSSFSNTSVALPTSQIVRKPFRCFTYDTAYSPTLLSLLLRHRVLNYVTWRAVHV